MRSRSFAVAPTMISLLLVAPAGPLLQGCSDGSGKVVADGLSEADGAGGNGSNAEDASDGGSPNDVPEDAGDGRDGIAAEGSSADSMIADSAGEDTTGADSTTTDAVGTDSASEDATDGPDSGAGACATLAPILPSTTSAPTCLASSYTKSTFVYAASSPTNVLDLYLPKGPGPFPTVVWIHGGGWMGGSRSDVNDAIRLVCRGFALASVDYRLSWQAKFPAQIHDVKAAIRYLRAKSGDLSLDSTKIAVFGSSAGGHLAALTGSSGGVTAMEDLSMGNAGESSAVQAVVDWYGPTDFPQMDPELIAQGCGNANHNAPNSPESNLLGCALPSCPASAVLAASPLTYVDQDDPPFLILHGTDDCTVPPAQSASLDSALRGVGACPVFRLVTGVGHGGNEWQSTNLQDEVATFLLGAFAQ